MQCFIVCREQGRMIEISWMHRMGSMKLTPGMEAKPRNIRGDKQRDIISQNVRGKWTWLAPSCGSGNCYIVYIHCTCLRQWQKNPGLSKNSEFTSTGVSLWGLHKLAGKEQNSKSIEAPVILTTVLRTEWKKFSFATVFVNWFNPQSDETWDTWLWVLPKVTTHPSCQK